MKLLRLIVVICCKIAGPQVEVKSVFPAVRAEWEQGVVRVCDSAAAVRQVKNGCSLCYTNHIPVSVIGCVHVSSIQTACTYMRTRNQPEDPQPIAQHDAISLHHTHTHACPSTHVRTLTNSINGYEGFYYNRPSASCTKNMLSSK